MFRSLGHPIYSDIEALKARVIEHMFIHVYMQVLFHLLKQYNNDKSTVEQKYRYTVVFGVS